MRLSWIWVALLGLAAAIYFPALKGGFLFDDLPNIVDNPAVHLTHFSITGLKDSLAGLSAGPLGRPISVWSFALTHLFFGLSAYAFKAVNLAIHVINGLLVGWFVGLLLHYARAPLRISAQARKWLPVCAAALWLVHPIHFVATMMAVQRMTLLAGTFTLLALIAHLKAMSLPQGRTRWGWLAAGWLVFWPLAVFSKESGLLFPAYVLAIIWLAPKPDSYLQTTRRNTVVISAVAIALAGLGMLWHIGWSWLEAGYAARPFTLTERLLTEARVLWFYLGQIVVPSYYSFALYLDWFPLSTGLLAPPATAVALAAWCLAIAAAVLARQRAPMLGFALAWFLLGHSLESGFVPLEIAHEHRNYLPALGPILGVAYFGARLLERLRLDNPRLTAGALAIAMVFLLALFTALRSLQMSSSLEGFQIEATRHPMSARANHTAALALMSAGYGDVGDPMGGINVKFYFEQAEKVDPAFKLGYLGLLIWACGSERQVETEWIDGFVEKLKSTPFGHGQKQLPAYLLRPLVKMPGCLPRQDALRLFSAGSENQRLNSVIRSQFLEAASDYELLVWSDLASARAYLGQAAVLSPHDARLRQKLNSYSQP
jgi:hypothetical protein